jgi:hypothetical protein
MFSLSIHPLVDISIDSCYQKHKKAARMAQEVELGRSEALSSNHSTTKKKKKKRNTYAGETVKK